MLIHRDFVQLCSSSHHRFGRQPPRSDDRQVEQLCSEPHQKAHEGNVDWPCHHPQLVLPPR